jgi:hypothetical protein
MYHQFHARHGHVWSSSSLLNTVDNQLQHDLNSAGAKTGVAANLHYTRSARTGTPTVLSHDQIKYLVKKNSKGKEATDEDGTQNGEIDNIYEYLEQTGNYYISILSQSPTLESDTSID